MQIGIFDTAVEAAVAYARHSRRGGGGGGGGGAASSAVDGLRLQRNEAACGDGEVKRGEGNFDAQMYDGCDQEVLAAALGGRAAVACARHCRRGEPKNGRPKRPSPGYMRFCQRNRATVASTRSKGGSKRRDRWKASAERGLTSRTLRRRRWRRRWRTATRTMRTVPATRARRRSPSSASDRSSSAADRALRDRTLRVGTVVEAYFETPVWGEGRKRVLFRGEVGEREGARQELAPVLGARGAVARRGRGGTCGGVDFSQVGVYMNEIFSDEVNKHFDGLAVPRDSTRRRRQRAQQPRRCAAQQAAAAREQEEAGGGGRRWRSRSGGGGKRHKADVTAPAPAPAPFGRRRRPTSLPPPTSRASAGWTAVDNQ